MNHKHIFSASTITDMERDDHTRGEGHQIPNRTKKATPLEHGSEPAVTVIIIIHPNVTYYSYNKNEVGSHLHSQGSPTNNTGVFQDNWYGDAANG